MSNVIKRQQATPLEPQRIDSVPLFETKLEVVDDYDYEQELRNQYATLRQEQETFHAYREETENELERLKDSTLEIARQEGYSAGFERGRQEGKAEFEELTTRLNNVSTELELLFEEKWRAAEKRLIHLAVEISARVTTDLVRKEEALFAAMINNQIQAELDAETLTIYVHPSRLASIQHLTSAWETDDTPKLKFRADAALSETDARIETPRHGSELDLTYSFERIKGKIEEVLSDDAY